MNLEGKKAKIFIGGAAVLLLVAAFSIGTLWKQLQDFRQNPQKAAQDETASILAAVGKLLVLPDGETPTIATVTDPEKLKDQVFFANAKTGDKVLIYTGAKKAILYDPLANKIVEVAPLNIDSSAPKSK